MFVFRIGGNKHIEELSGKGASINGGRWNRVGVPILYTGSSIALCAWEYWVHLPPTLNLAQNAFSRVTINIPESSILELKMSALPQTWPAEGEELYSITDSWLAENEYLCLRVPSAVITGDFNYLINPQHELMAEVEIVDKQLYSFDERAFGKSLIREPVQAMGNFPSAWIGGRGSII